MWQNVEVQVEYLCKALHMRETKAESTDIATVLTFNGNALN